MPRKADRLLRKKRLATMLVFGLVVGGLTVTSAPKVEEAAKPARAE